MLLIIKKDINNVPLGLDDAQQVVVIVIRIQEQLGRLVELKALDPRVDHIAHHVLSHGLLVLLVLYQSLKCVLDVDFLGRQEVLQTHALAYYY